jgi:seryl-tRNA synthetase
VRVPFSPALGLIPPTHRDKAQKLVKAEATIEKYQKKMEGMTALKNEVSPIPSLCCIDKTKTQNKQLEETIDRYLEQIHELEAAKNSATTTVKMVEKVCSIHPHLLSLSDWVQYKDKSVVLERERFEALTSMTPFFSLLLATCGRCTLTCPQLWT